MASTKAVSDAITRAQNELKGITLATTDALDLANEVYQIIGTATYWDWLIATGTTFGTTVDTQDYSNVPSDFRRLKAAYINDDSSTYTSMWQLDIRETLPLTNIRGIPYAISVENAKFRLVPKPNITRSGSGQWAILFDYWKRPKRLTLTTDTFEFDDAYFEIFATGFTARVAEFVRFEGAGQWMGRRPDIGRFAGTGLWGKFAELLNAEVQDEEMASGPVVYAPESGLMRG